MGERRRDCKNGNAADPVWTTATTCAKLLLVLYPLGIGGQLRLHIANETGLSFLAKLLWQIGWSLS